MFVTHSAMPSVCWYFATVDTFKTIDGCAHAGTLAVFICPIILTGRSERGEGRS